MTQTDREKCCEKCSLPGDGCDRFDCPCHSELSQEKEQCPVCGYYCLGKGGYGCIDKPSVVSHAKVCKGHEHPDDGVFEIRDCPLCNGDLAFIEEDGFKTANDTIKTGYSEPYNEPQHKDFIEDTLKEFRGYYAGYLPEYARPKFENFLKEKLEEAETRAAIECGEHELIAVEAERTRIIELANNLRRTDEMQLSCDHDYDEALDDLIKAIGE